jgi:hypothetical protein
MTLQRYALPPAPSVIMYSVVAGILPCNKLPGKVRADNLGRSAGRCTRDNLYTGLIECSHRFSAQPAGYNQRHALLCKPGGDDARGVGRWHGTRLTQYPPIAYIVDSKLRCVSEVGTQAVPVKRKCDALVTRFRLNVPAGGLAGPYLAGIIGIR